jgi:hypothetical protein
MAPLERWEVGTPLRSTSRHIKPRPSIRQPSRCCFQVISTTTGDGVAKKTAPGTGTVERRGECGVEVAWRAEAERMG